MASFAVDAVEYRMAASLKQSIKRITKDKSGLSEIAQEHYLQGTFKQLCKTDTLRELLFPGTPKEILRNLPKDLKEVLAWTDLQLDMDKIAKNAAEVLNNIKIKGAKQGNMMDDATERVLLPQIAQEALSKGIIEAVRKLNVKVSGTIAKMARPVASPTDERATRDQIEEDVIQQLLNFRFAVQQEYVGEDWWPLLQGDLQRYMSNEKMSTLNEKGEVVLKTNDTKIEEIDTNCSMCWLENDESLKEFYPALAELLGQMHALPFELNAKCNFRNMQLIEPGKGCTMLIHYPLGSSQKVRLDSRTDSPDLDSGIRITCTFHIKAPTSGLHGVENDGSHISLESIRDVSNKTDFKVENDMLVMHYSTEMKNDRSPDANEEWFAIVFFIHGKEGGESN